MNTFKTASLLLLLFITSSAFAQLIPYNKKGTWGYCSADKKMVIQPEYEQAEPFIGNTAIVVKNGKYGVIDKKNKKIIDITYDHIDRASRMNMMLYYGTSGERYTVWDSKGKVIFTKAGKNVQAIYPFFFLNGDDDKDTLYSIEGKRIAAGHGMEVNTFLTYYTVRLKDAGGIKEMLIDGTGNVILPLEDQRIDYKFYGKLYEEGGKLERKVKEATGKERAKLEAELAKGTLLISDKDDKLTIMDYKGKVIIPAQYEEIDNSVLKYNLLLVTKPGDRPTEDIYNVKGKKLNTESYEKISLEGEKNDSYYLATFRGELEGMMNLKGEVLIPLVASDIEIHDDLVAITLPSHKRKYIKLNTVLKDTLSGFWPASGEWTGTAHKNGLAEIKVNGKAGVTSLDNKLIVPAEYEYVQINDQHIIAHKENKTTVFTRDGKTVNIPQQSKDQYVYYCLDIKNRSFLFTSRDSFYYSYNGAVKPIASLNSNIFTNGEQTGYVEPVFMERGNNKAYAWMIKNDTLLVLEFAGGNYKQILRVRNTGVEPFNGRVVLNGGDSSACYTTTGEVLIPWGKHNIFDATLEYGEASGFLVAQGKESSVYSFEGKRLIGPLNNVNIELREVYNAYGVYITAPGRKPYAIVYNPHTKVFLDIPVTDYSEMETYMVQLDDTLGRSHILDPKTFKTTMIPYKMVSGVEIYSDTNPGVYLVTDATKEKFGLATDKGKVICKPEYDMIEPSETDAFYSVSKDGKWGAMDSTGKLFIPVKYDRVYQDHKGFMIATMGSAINDIYSTSGQIAYPSNITEAFIQGSITEGKNTFIFIGGTVKQNGEDADFNGYIGKDGTQYFDL